MEPLDRELIAHVRPPDWVNPTPAPRYDLVVVGGGTAGLVAAAGAAGLGARVALVERHRLGGDCLNTGCVPSKTLISGARQRITFADAMARIRRTRAAIAPHDSAQRFAALGVDVFFGAAQFADADSLVVDTQRLRFARAAIATGSRPLMPSVPGLADAAPMTSETVWDLDTPPRRMAIVGGGPIGCELAQAFQRLGIEVVLFHDGPRLLEQAAPDAAAIVDDTLRREGVRLVLGARLVRVHTREGNHTIAFETASGPGTAEIDAILVAAGRTPNVSGLGLDAAGVALDGHGRIRVDDFLRTTSPRIYACGDVCLPWQFTHAADASARIVIQNALFAMGPVGRRRVSDLIMSWCIYTDPEVAQVGVMAGDAYTQPLASLDRAMTDGVTQGFVTIVTRPGTGTIAGATIVGPRAGDLIAEVSVAMAGTLSLAALAGVVHPYPTYAEAIRTCGDAYNRTRLTPRVKALLSWWLRRLR